MSTKIDAPADDITLPAIQRAGSTLYVLNASGINLWSAQVQPGRTDDDKRLPDAECERIAAALAARSSPSRAGAVAAWPKDAVEVRAFFDPHCEVVQYAIDVKTPAEGDRYQLTAHDFLSAINWWADYHATPAAPPVPAAVDVGAAQASEETAEQAFARVLCQAEAAEFPDAEQIGALEFRRDQYGFTQEQMARVLGMQQSHYSEFVNGHRALPRAAMCRAVAVGVPAAVLLDALATQKGAQAMSGKTDREDFEVWLKTTPGALYWNTSDGLFAAYQGGRTDQVAAAQAETAQAAPADVVAWQVRRIDGDGGPLTNWESCTQDLYEATLATGRYGGYENGPPCEVRALSVAATPGATHGN